MRVHTYVIAVDSGAAPNYDQPFTTLAVCKPRIRKKAAVGDFVLAFAGKDVNPFEPHTVVWAGIVSEKMTFADYWNDKRFTGKKPACWKNPDACRQEGRCTRPDRCQYPDNFYRPVDSGLMWVENPVHDADAAQHDTNGLYVLAFDPSWCFRANGPLMPSEFGLRMTHGRRGERVVDLSDVEWRRLKAWLDGQAQVEKAPSLSGKRCRPKVVMAPTAPTRSRRSNC